MPTADNRNLIGKKAEPIPVPQKEIGIDTNNVFQNDILDAAEVSELNLSTLQNFSNVAQTREEIYTLIDTMAQDDTISSILETYAEDIVESNDKGQIVWCESSDAKVSEYVSYLLDVLNVDKHIYDWSYNLVKYGDLYLRLYRESDYGDDLLFGDEKSKKKDTLNEDINLKVSEPNDHYVHYVEEVSNPGEMFELTKFGKTMGYIQAPANVQQQYDKSSSLDYILNYKMRKGDVNVYSATDFVHCCLQTSSNRSPEEISIFMNQEDLEANKVSATYKVRKGQSLLANNFKIWREMSLLENSILLNRLTRSAIVRILNVDTGDMPKEQVNNFISRLKERIEQKSAINTDVSLTEYTNPGPIENIIYVPTHGTQGSITASVIGGDGVDVKGLSDLDYFQNKLYGAFRVPKQFFGNTDDGAGFNGGQSLAIISSRYGKAIKKIQNTICQCITDVINLFLLDKGLDNYVNNFVIRMQSPVTQEELDRRENMRNRVGVINDIMSQIDGVVTDEVLKAKILKSLMTSAVSDPDVIGYLQDQIDMLEEGEEEGETKKEEGEEEEEPKRPKPMSDFGSTEPTFNEPIEEPETEPEVEEPTETEIGGAEETIEAPEDSYLPSPDELGISMV